MAPACCGLFTLTEEGAISCPNILTQGSHPPPRRACPRAPAPESSRPCAARSAAGAARGAAPGRPACTLPSTTSAARRTRSSCRTSARGRARRSWHAASSLSRGSAWRSRRAGLPELRARRPADRGRGQAQVRQALQPRQNSKAEGMNRTPAQEWRHGRAWDGKAGRTDALPAFIERCNWDRPHSACGGLPPMSRIVGVNNLSAHNT